MKHLAKLRSVGLFLCLSVSLLATGLYIKNLQPFRDPTGYFATYKTGGDIDESSAFFQPLGTNGRTCATCHQADQAFTLNAAHVRELFLKTKGNDPLFAPVDGANCPDGKKGDAADHSLLLKNGLIRVGITLPTNTEFNITVLHDPYGCAITTDPATGQPVISVYRRPLPSASLRFLNTIMWDGRETVEHLDSEGSFQANLFTDLKHQARDAVLGHSQASSSPSDEQLAEIVNFELGLFTAQISDDRARALFLGGVHGGPLYLQAQPYYPGINDSLGHDPHGGMFDPHVFTLYTKWLPKNRAEGQLSDEQAEHAAREEIAAGEHLFNSAPLKITGVRGLNDNPALGDPKEIVGTCSTCHDTPGVGNHSLPLPLDIATSHSAGYETDQKIAEALAQLSVPEVPIYLVDCPAPYGPGHRLQFYTSDPGKGLITGKCGDVNRIKGPILRGLAARAPYFHNGAAANLDELVNFYNKRFQMQLTEEQKNNLVAFLSSL